VEWSDFLASEMAKPYFKALMAKLDTEAALGKIIYPPKSEIFNAFTLCPLSQIKVVILGQDPYHNAGQAHGLSFSVPKGVKAPPSLVNILKEIQADLQLPMPNHANLNQWAQQGVLLLNACLTVEAHQAGSHQKWGWEQFTDAVIQYLSDNCSGVVFMLWGNFAKQKKHLIGPQHLVLEAAHPSPFSAYQGFFGCRHFSKANAFLQANQKPIIDWALHD
jgi:uracil-DNA glycosylase